MSALVIAPEYRNYTRCLELSSSHGVNSNELVVISHRCTQKAPFCCCSLRGCSRNWGCCCWNCRLSFMFLLFSNFNEIVDTVIFSSEGKAKREDFFLSTLGLFLSFSMCTSAVFFFCFCNFLAKQFTSARPFLGLTIVAAESRLVFKSFR